MCDLPIGLDDGPPYRIEEGQLCEWSTFKEDLATTFPDRGAAARVADMYHRHKHVGRPATGTDAVRVIDHAGNTVWIRSKAGHFIGLTGYFADPTATG